MTWEEIKQGGSEHYKEGDIQPIDVYRAMNTEALHHWAILEICQHALRNLSPSATLEKDMTKIKHYADMVMANRD